ncbi:MAG: DUF1294 domain-containing protein [Caldilineales bacterium]|nr:DUF1294 domain-containing protein [Caldilineales bacterium]
MSKSSPKQTYSLIFILLVAILFLVLAIFTAINPFLLWLIAATVITFALYGYDKAQAKRGGGRVPEIVLHGAALAGGFLGGWAGMYLFRHKTLHTGFKIVLALATVLWLVLLYFIFFA